jgi:hypothetical protein
MEEFAMLRITNLPPAAISIRVRPRPDLMWVSRNARTLHVYFGPKGHRSGEQRALLARKNIETMYGSAVKVCRSYRELSLTRAIVLGSEKPWWF